MAYGVRDMGLSPLHLDGQGDGFQAHSPFHTMFCHFLFHIFIFHGGHIFFILIKKI